MKVAWKDFAQRRKIDIEMFTAMTYQNYCSWCEQRRVEPVPQESFEGVKRLLVPEAKSSPPECVTTVTTHKFDKRQLKKLRKAALITLCGEQDITVDASETKADIITKLLSLNNDK